MKLLPLLLLAAGFAFPAGDPAGFYLWKSSDVKAFPSMLASKTGTGGIASQPLANLGNYTFAAVLRKQSGEAEIHETQADIFVITAGEGTLTVGGTVPDAKTTQPHELRGTTISGGVAKKVAAGDVLTIPAKMPHQLKVDAGKEISYLAVKVTQE